MRKFEGNQHIPQLSDMSVITCDYGLRDINTVIIDRASDFWKECRSTIDYFAYPRDDHECLG